MNEAVVDALADLLAVYRLEPKPSRTTQAVARNIIRSLQATGYTITPCNKQERTTAQ